MAFDEPMLWCAGRHHIYELVAKAVWGAVFPGPSVCPGEKLIQDFSAWWSKTTTFPRDFTAEDRPFLIEDEGLFDDCLDDLSKLSKAARANGNSFQRGDYDEPMELFEVKTNV